MKRRQYTRTRAELEKRIKEAARQLLDAEVELNHAKGLLIYLIVEAKERRIPLPPRITKAYLSR